MPTGLFAQNNEAKEALKTVLSEEYQSSEQHRSWYFFTDRTRKYLGGKRPARSTPNGFWKATEADTLIKDQGKVIGRRMTLKFLWGHQREGKHWDSGWMMREYRIEEFQIPSSQKRKGKTPKNPAGSECNMKLDEAVLCKVYKVQNKNAGRKRHEASRNSSSDSLLDVVYPIQGQSTIQPSGLFFPVPCPGYDPNHNTNGLIFSRPNERGRLPNRVNPNYFSTMNQTRSYPTKSVVYPSLPNWCPSGSEPCLYEGESNLSNFLNVNGMCVQLALSQDIHQRQLSICPEQSENLSSGAVFDVARRTQSLSQYSTEGLPSSHPSPVPCSATDSMYNNGWRLFNQVNSSYSSTVSQDQSYETNSVVNPNLPTWCIGSTNLNSFYIDPSQSGFLDENGFFAVSDTQRLRPNYLSIIP
ncbi:uncharacterized protein A4U43_C06F6940 [Asparagus officinalis]|uniref:NAC domain-containing protein n=1 Tax=Asparagus officinalis TaxID=4686 RepID=A0A5P1EK70_ASPOF|nr:uncharacterized protein A4U43_C06F6940 [Asparagus officinalis]